MINKFKNWDIINESAPRLPIKEEYWLKKGKVGKKVALYIHDDMDGIFCGIEMKKWLLNKGFEIVKYGILNYSEGWKYTTLDSSLINIVLDFANMPNDERDQHIDYYLDHHGLFNEDDIEKYKKSPVQKKKTASAYEAVCQALGVPQDELTLKVIDMIDAAKYQEYDVSWQRLLSWNLNEIKKSDKRRLEFAAAFNQFLKRSDAKTLLSVVHNCKDASIYSIFTIMKLVYPEHNTYPSGINKGKKKEFMVDSLWRLGEMQKKTRGKNTRNKKEYTSLSQFTDDFGKYGAIRPDGYQLIGNLVFVPTGTWANALRARTIVERDFNDGVLPKEPSFILLQYGGTLQVCSYKKMNEIDNLPTLKNGSKVEDLGKYMITLLDNFKKHLGYYDPDTSIGQDEITVSGGHGGIGSISNIFGTCKVSPYNGIRYIDMFKNKIITDLSGVSFNMATSWGEASESKGKEPDIDNKVIKTSDITKVGNDGKVIKRFDDI